MSQVCVEAQNLTKDYQGIRGIQDVTFSLSQGEMVALVGPNGAGKSTVLKILSGLLYPSHGQLKIQGKDVTTHPLERARSLGYLSEIPPLYEDLTVEEYLLYALKLRGLGCAEKNNAFSFGVERLNLQKVLKRRIFSLSKGYKQRIGIAQAIATLPPLIILDEPTVGLDPEQMRDVRQLFLELKGKQTVILSTHLLSEVESTCQRIIMMKEGRIHKDWSQSEGDLFVQKNQSWILEFIGPFQGSLQSIRSEFKWIENIELQSSHLLRVWTARDQQTLSPLVQSLMEKGIEIKGFYKVDPKLEEFYVQTLQGHGQGERR